MADDDDVPALSAETFAALQEFYSEQAKRQEIFDKLQAEDKLKENVLFDENWISDDYLNDVYSDDDDPTDHSEEDDDGLNYTEWDEDDSCSEYEAPTSPEVQKTCQNQDLIANEEENTSQAIKSPNQALMATEKEKTSPATKRQNQDLIATKEENASQAIKRPRSNEFVHDQPTPKLSPSTSHENRNTKRRRSGAAKKRCRLWVELGFTKEEALRRSLRPLSDFPEYLKIKDAKTQKTNQNQDLIATEEENASQAIKRPKDAETQKTIQNQDLKASEEEKTVKNQNQVLIATEEEKTSQAIKRPRSNESVDVETCPKLNSSTLQENQNTKRDGITGAAKRRYYFWIKHGLTEEEAKLRCLRPKEDFPEYLDIIAAEKQQKYHFWINHGFTKQEAELRCPRPLTHFPEYLKIKAAETPNESVDDQKTTRERLSRAARRRYQFWINHGLTKEEAELRCPLPLTHFPEYLMIKAAKMTERPISSELSQTGKRPISSEPSLVVDYLTYKKRKLREEGQGLTKKYLERMKNEASLSGAAKKKSQEFSKDETEGDNCDSADNFVKIGIKDDNREITSHMVELIEKEMYRYIDSSTSSGPRFINHKIRAGCVIFTCRNKQTRDWLINHIDRFKLWKDASIRIIDEEKLPKQILVIMSIPKKTPTKILLNRLSCQNSEIGCERWKVLSVKEEKKGQTFCFSIDRSSMAALKKANSGLFYGLRKIKVFIKDLSKKSDESTNTLKPSSIPCSQQSFEKSKALPAANKSRTTTEHIPNSSKNRGLSAQDYYASENRVSRPSGITKLQRVTPSIRISHPSGSKDLGAKDALVSRYSASDQSESMRSQHDISSDHISHPSGSIDLGVQDAFVPTNWAHHSVGTSHQPGGSSVLQFPSTNRVSNAQNSIAIQNMIFRPTRTSSNLKHRTYDAHTSRSTDLGARDAFNPTSWAPHSVGTSSQSGGSSDFSYPSKSRVLNIQNSFPTRTSSDRILYPVESKRLNPQHDIFSDHIAHTSRNTDLGSKNDFNPATWAPHSFGTSYREGGQPNQHGSSSDFSYPPGSRELNAQNSFATPNRLFNRRNPSDHIMENRRLNPENTCWASYSVKVSSQPDASCTSYPSGSSGLTAPNTFAPRNWAPNSIGNVMAQRSAFPADVSFPSGNQHYDFGPTSSAQPSIGTLRAQLGGSQDYRGGDNAPKYSLSQQVARGRSAGLPSLPPNPRGGYYTRR